MRGVVVVDHREVQSSRQHPASACVLGEAARVAPLEDAGCPLWAYRLELTDETLAQWSADHHDEVLLVLSGALRDQAGQWSCGPGDAYVIEAGVPAQVVLEAGTDLVHFGSRGGEPWGVLGPPVGAGSCYPLPATGRATHDTPLGGVVVTTSFWADSTRASRRLALLEVAGTGGHASPPHAHSADEIIFVVEG
ncbi:MAG: hypothetical protein JWL64_1951 [Frankiales bacterium]|nr:hypothetical protein [Frankiales bacterium]